MENRLRRRGRFISQKQLEQHPRFAKIRSEVMSRKNETQGKAKILVGPGRQIVELEELGKNLKCSKCHEVLSLENIVKETRMGLNSILNVLCETCSVITLVSTGKHHFSRLCQRDISDVNTKAVFGNDYF